MFQATFYTLTSKFFFFFKFRFVLYIANNALLLDLNCIQFVTLACAHQAWRRTLYICLDHVVGQST